MSAIPSPTETPLRGAVYGREQLLRCSRGEIFGEGLGASFTVRLPAGRSHLPADAVTVTQEADARGVFLGDEVMDFILHRFSRDLGSLMQLLDHLDTYALQAQRAITIPLVKSMLEDE